jgi:hypothetical protein
MSFSSKLLSRITSMVSERKRFLVVVAVGDEQEDAGEEDNDEDAGCCSGQQFDLEMLLAEQPGSAFTKKREQAFLGLG